jgi:CheY-like chemotaxis protein
VVEDSGDGIPEAMLEDIFEPFVQVTRDGSTRGGLGLGLTLVRQLVKLHDGTIVAESEGPGRGSRFVVRLPVGEAPEPGEAAEAGERPKPRPGLSVLIVDDNVDAAAGLADLLEIHGCAVRVATGPDAARQAFEAGRPEVLLLDLDLPGKSGYELLEELRGADLVGDCEVVVITGFGHEEARLRSRDAGIEHHLIKPVDLGELLALLAQR